MCVILYGKELGVKVWVKYHSCDIMKEDLGKATAHWTEKQTKYMAHLTQITPRWAKIVHKSFYKR